MFSLGLFLDRHGKVEDVLWNGPAFKAGLAPGMELLAIDGRSFSVDVLRDEIVQAQTSRKPLQITAKGDGVTGVYSLDYDGGLKYPHLVRVPGTTDYLEEILAPKPLQ
jgi:predicted metalloprotease with PDZ domain